MNFLLRNTHPVAPDLPSIPESEPQKDTRMIPKSPTTLEGLIAEDPFPNSSASDDGDRDSDGVGDTSGTTLGSNPKDQVPRGKHSDVAEDEGWITIPDRKLPDDWSTAMNILQLRTFDRSFVFPGEQLHILVCLTATKQDAEIITPFRVAAVISKNGSSAQTVKQQVGVSDGKSIFNGEIGKQGDSNGIHEGESGLAAEVVNSESVPTSENLDPEHDISATESLLRMEDQKQKTEILLERFRNSNFFVRISESDEPLWSKRNVLESSSVDSDMEATGLRRNDSSLRQTSKGKLINAIVDRGNFDGNTSGGVARNTARCYSLSNGDIVVLLQVNVADGSMKDPVLEVLQFENYKANTCTSENPSGLHDDPCHELLNWLLPLDRSLPPPRSLSPPISSSSVLASVSQKGSSASPGSQLFSFSHFRSYSMPSHPQNSVSSAVASANAKSSFDLEDFDRFTPEKLTRSQDAGNEGLLSFRGVPLEPERFSVNCGLEGIYLPGRRWRRKLEIIQPIEIHSFPADCVTEDLLCVQIKNVSPAHVPDVVMFLDAITLVFEEASKSGPPLSLPIASIETGDGHSLPNLALRRGEEHSFILKPITTRGGGLRGPSNTSSLVSHSKIGAPSPNMHLISRVGDRKVSPSTDQYAVLVSCRCNYTESKLFFKHPTSWRPRVARDLMISLASEMPKQAIGANELVPQLPVQVLTLQASNLTHEDLTLTVVAPISSNSSPSVVSLNSAPTTPMSSFAGFPEFTGRVRTDRERQIEGEVNGKGSASLGVRTGTTSDVISNSDFGCTHLWLQSTVPLGCVPARSSATVKLELLPLTDGIITLDTLQVAVKEKGQIYTPEKPLKIHVTSGQSTGNM